MLWWPVLGVSHLFLSYFREISHLFLSYFSLLGYFLTYFSNISHFSLIFPIISRLFLTSQLFSQLFLSYISHFSVTFPISQSPSQLFLNRPRGFGAYWREKLNPRVMMDEVKFLYECVKAGKLSNAEAKEFLSSGGSSESRERGQQLKVAAGAATVPAVRNEADTGTYITILKTISG